MFPIERLSETGRILAVFTKPKRAMEDIGGYPTVLVPIMCMIVFPLFSVIINMSYYRDQLLTAMATQMQQVGMTMDLGSLVQIQLYAMLVMMPVQTIIGWLLFSTLVYFLGQLFGGDGELTYKMVLSITGYAFLIMSLFYVISAILLAVDSSYAIQFSLYDIVNRISPIENLFVTGVLQMFSIFKLWEFALVAIGLHINKQMAVGKAVAVLAIVFLLQCGLTFAQLALASGLGVQV